MRRHTPRLAGSTLAVWAFILFTGCARNGESPESQPDVPHGYMQVVRLEKDGRVISVGPFVGYYFRPADHGDLSRLRFVCFNERRFYASDAPAGKQLYRGEAVQATLPEVDFEVPHRGRINPVFFPDAPDAWLATRPEPVDAFAHFHSGYDAAGPTMTGYWLRHEALAEFTYDMGGRVSAGSPLHHAVKPGPDRDFPRIIEFDFGPRSETP